MIEKMRFVSIIGPKDDIDRVTDTYLSKYDIHLENTLTELNGLKNIHPFLEANPYQQLQRNVSELQQVIKFEPENKIEISNQVSIACGKEMHIKYIDTKPQDDGQMSEEQELSNVANEFDIPFDIIE